MYCLPPAGSSSMIYNQWQSALNEISVNSKISIIPIEYPGHGKKMKESLINDPNQLAKNIVSEIIALDIQHKKRPIILFGHSVGSALLWKVLEHLPQSSMDMLQLVVVSGRPAPKYTCEMPFKHTMSDKKMIAELRRYGGTSEELLENKDYLALFLQLLRNDFYVSDQLLTHIPMKINKPLLAIYGDSDPDIPSQELMDAWSIYSSHWLGAYAYSGGHFYFNNKDSLYQMLTELMTLIFQLQVHKD